MSMDYPRDFIEYGLVSECCGAPIIMSDLCMECKEHCSGIPEDEDEEDTENCEDCFMWLPQCKCKEKKNV